MRTRSIFLQFAVFVGIARSADSSAYLWTFDERTPKYAGQVSTTSSDTARAIIARRRGLSEVDFITSTDESTLSEINQFGGYLSPLFGAGTDIPPPKLLIRISGFDGTVSEFNSLPDLWIEQPTRDLLDDFVARTGVEGVCEYDLKVPMKSNVNVVYSYVPQEKTCIPMKEVEMLPTIMALYSSVPTEKTVAGKGMTSFSRMLRHFQATSNIESTVVILPSPSKLVKTTTNLDKAPSLSKREEEPLDLPSNSAPLPGSPVGASIAASSHALPSIIPQCFRSNNTCTNTTNSCSGHGHCYKAHNDCYKCRCGSTVVRTNKDGTEKTVQWGGNACEKKDVSTPFILFASFGVAFTTLVAGGIGMLYSMGSQQLPSVIGAGVVGPRAQR